MATFHKLVLGLLLLFSLLIGQPSNAQGLKYRGTVGIDFIGGYDEGSITASSDYVFEFGRRTLYVAKHMLDPTFKQDRMVLIDSIPIPDLPNNNNSLWSQVTVTENGQTVILYVGEYNTAFRRVFVIDVVSKAIKSWNVPDARGISNPSGGRFCVTAGDNKVFTYDFAGNQVGQKDIKVDFPLTYINKYIPFSYDGTNTYHYTSSKRIGRSNGSGMFDAWIYADSNVFGTVTTVDSKGRMYIGGSYSYPGDVYVTNGFTKPVFLIRGRLTVVCKNLIVCNGGWVRLLDGTVVSVDYGNSAVRALSTYNVQGRSIAAKQTNDFVSIGQIDIQLWSEYGEWLGMTKLTEPVASANFSDNVQVTSDLSILFTQSDSSYEIRNIAKISSDYKTNIVRRYFGRPFRYVNQERIAYFQYDSQLRIDRLRIDNPLDTKVYERQLDLRGDILDMFSNGDWLVVEIDYEVADKFYVSVFSSDLSLRKSNFALDRNDGWIDAVALPDGNILVSDWDRLRTFTQDGQLVSTTPLKLADYPITYWKTLTDRIAVNSVGVVWVQEAYKYDGPAGGLTHIYFADPNPPKTSASITSGWYRSNQTVQLTSVDPRPSSGFKALHSVLDTDAEVVDANPNRTINISGDGQHKLIYWAEDVDGNIETKNELSIGIDSVPPVVYSVVEGNKFILLANDDRSGIASVRYSVDGANDLEYSGEVSLPYGSYEVVFWATDKAGNKSTVGKILVGSTFRWKSVYSSPIYAGKTLKATLELTAPAGSNGVTLDISSSDPSLGSLKSATILPGKTATTIEIPVLGVESDRLVDLSASLGGKTARTSVTVLVPYPSFIAINPRDVMGGNNITITIKLPSVAPIGGQKITLSSSDSRIFVPESVTVPSGQTTITLPIATQVSSTPFSATINARAGGKGSDAVVNVLSLPSATFTISPAILNPGQKAVGVITLSSPAPASGVQFKLSSSSQDITLPSTVTILPGSVRVLFDITAKSPLTPVTSTVTATVDKTKLTSKVSIKPSVFKAVKLSSSSFSGEGTVVGTVELTGIAPSSGSLISLASNNANVSLPATVFVPAGSLIANFTVDVKEVKTPGIATITARSGVVVKFASLTLAPITIKTLEAVPSAVTGGSASVLRIELTGKPGPGGITVTLSSSNSSVASVPASVSVAQGTTIVEVPIATTSVQTATEVVLSARVGTITKQATITVNP